MNNIYVLLEVWYEGDSNQVESFVSVGRSIDKLRDAVFFARVFLPGETPPDDGSYGNYPKTYRIVKVDNEVKMLPSKINFKVRKRVNTFVTNDKEYVLGVQLDDNNPWVLTEWDNEPSKQQVQRAKDICLMAMQIYHASFRMPTFELKVKNEDKK